MLRKTPWKHQNTTQSSGKKMPLRLRLSTQASLIALSALLMTACSTPQGTSTSSHKIQSAHSNDIWQRIRDKFAMPELENAEVGARENYYATRADYVGRMATRSGDFLYLIMDEVERRRMPSELALLPFVESAFVTSAKSSAAASGLWQFMPATGRDFSLQQNRFADQRNDVMASTSAALDYLQRLYNMYGDWHLALAAYNWGQGNVNRAVSRSLSAGGSGKYTDINMPLETRQYVPKLQAIKNIVRNPSVYGISLPSIPNRLRHEAVLVTRDIDVSTAADLANLSEDEFKRLNPAHKKPVIVAALNSKIIVPADRADEFRRALSDNTRQLASLTTYTTYSTEALSDIANKYHTDENRLRELNSIPYSHNYVRADSTLIVPRTRKNDEIPYLALNSSVRSITGDVGITDYNSYDTSGLVASTGISSNSNITAPGRATTGLVAEASDADQLSTLISSAPSTPSARAYNATPVVIRTPEPSIDTAPRPTRIADNQKADILVMPPVAKTAPVAETADITPDPIAQITQTAPTLPAAEVARPSIETTAAPTTANNSVSAATAATDKAVPAASTYSTDSIIIPDTGTPLVETPAVVTTPPAKNGLSTTEKAVIAAAVVSAVSRPKEPAKAVTKTNYRAPQSAAPKTTIKAPIVVKEKPQATHTTNKVASQSSAAKLAANPKNPPVAKEVPKASKIASTKNSDKDNVKNASKTTVPNKPEPKKPDNKPVAAAQRAAVSTKNKAAATQQSPQKTATTGKISNKAEAKPAAKAPVKPELKPAVKPASKAAASSAPATGSGKSGSKGSSASSTVILPKKK